jgi:hypothetical protein
MTSKPILDEWIYNSNDSISHSPLPKLQKIKIEDLIKSMNEEKVYESNQSKLEYYGKIL